MLNLKRFSNPSDSGSMQTTIRSSSNRFLGNIGASLRNSDDENEDEGLVGEGLEEE